MVPSIKKAGMQSQQRRHWILLEIPPFSLQTLLCWKWNIYFLGEIHILRFRKLHHHFFHRTPSSECLIWWKGLWYWLHPFPASPDNQETRTIGQGLTLHLFSLANSPHLLSRMTSLWNLTVATSNLPQKKKNPISCFWGVPLCLP